MPLILLMPAGKPRKNSQKGKPTRSFPGEEDSLHPNSDTWQVAGKRLRQQLDTILHRSRASRQRMMHRPAQKSFSTITPETPSLDEFNEPATRPAVSPASFPKGSYTSPRGPVIRGPNPLADLFQENPFQGTSSAPTRNGGYQPAAENRRNTGTPAGNTESNRVEQPARRRPEAPTIDSNLPTNIYATPVTEFDLPQDLADEGLTIRRKTAKPAQTQRVITPAGRNFVKRTTGTTSASQPVPLPPSDIPEEEPDFDLGPEEEVYYGMLDGRPGSTGPETVADRLRQERTYTRNDQVAHQTRVVGEAPEEEETEDEEFLATAPLPRARQTPPNPALGELVVEPTYNPNKRFGRSGRRLRGVRFSSPAVAVGAGVVSALMLLIIVVLLYNIGGGLNKANPEKFSVLFSQLGEGPNYGRNPDDQTLAKSFGDNFLTKSNLTNADVRYNSNIIKTTEEAVTTANNTSADVVVWGYKDQANNRLYLNLTLKPNGPFDPPFGRGRQLVNRFLYDPDQFVFVTAPPADNSSGTLPLTQLLTALSAYYSGSYDTASASYTQLLNMNIPENEAALKMLRGNNLFLLGKYSEAISDYNQVENVNNAALSQGLKFPVSPAFVYNNRAVAYTFAGNAQEANKSFTAALSTSDNQPKIFANYAYLLLSQTEIQTQPAALADWQSRLSNALKLDPNLASTNHYLGQIYFYEGSYDEAIKNENQARILDESYLEAYYGLGMSYLERYIANPQAQGLNSAMDVFRWGESRAVNMVNQNRQRWQALNDNGNPTLAAVWDSRAREAQVQLDQLRFGIARVYLEQMRVKGKDLGNPLDRVLRWVKGEKTPYEEAGPRLKEYLDAHPKNPDANFYYGQYLDLSGDGDPVPYYQKAKSLEPSIPKRFKYYAALSQQYANAGKKAEAIKEYTDYIALDKNRVEGYLALSNLETKFGMYKEAVDAANNAIKVAPKDATAYLAAGVAQIANQQLQQAVNYLDRALVLNPNLAEAYLQRGIALFHLNRRNEALDSFTKALALNDQYAVAYYYSGIIYQENLNNTQAAQDQWEKALAVNPNYEEAWVKLGLLYSQQNKIDKAIEAYNHALLVNDKDALAHYYIGLLYEGKNTPDDLAKAENQYRRALELQPGLVNAQYHLAQVMELRGAKPDDVLQLAKKAAQMDPSNPDAQLALGDILRTQSKFDEAIAAYNNALKIRNNYPEALWGRASAQLGKNQYDAALADVNKALQLKPQWGDGYLLQGQIYAAKKQLNEAMSSFAQSKKYDPSNARLYAEMGKVEELQGLRDEAITSYEQSLSLSEQNPTVHERLGELYFAKGNFDSALKNFQRAQILDGNIQHIYYWIGRTYAYLKQPENAQNYLEKAVQQDPKQIEAHQELGNAYRILNQRDKALGQYQEAVKLQPGFGPAWLSMGQVYEELVDTPKAIEAYQNALKSNDASVVDAAQTALKRLGAR